MVSLQQGMQQPKSVKLMKLLSAENISSVLSDEKAVEALLAHLPEGAQNAYELQQTVRIELHNRSNSALCVVGLTRIFDACIHLLVALTAAPSEHRVAGERAANRQLQRRGHELWL